MESVQFDQSKLTREQKEQVFRCVQFVVSVPQCGGCVPVWWGVPQCKGMCPSVGQCVPAWEGVSLYGCVCRSMGGCAPVREGLPQRRRVGGMCMCPCHMCSWVRG